MVQAAQKQAAGRTRQEIFIRQMPSDYVYFGNQRDKLGFDYWASSANAMKIHRRFCRDRNSYGRDGIGIDPGMALLAIENHRTGLVCALMEGAGPTGPAFRAAKFRPTTEPEPRPVHVLYRGADYPV